MQHRQSQKTEHADDRRIYDLSDDKSSKDRIALNRQMQDHISLHRFEHCINDLFRLHGDHEKRARKTAGYSELFRAHI